MNKKEHKKEFFVTSIGPLLVNCLNKQKENIRRESYMVLTPSFYDAGEILAKKIIDKGLV